jgi:uncharacterized membrane protein
MNTLWEGILWLHLLAMAFFVGGQLLLVVAVVPVLRGHADRERLRAVARRFGYGTLAVLVVLAVTGIAMASHQSLWSSGRLHAKLALVGAVAVLVVWHVLRPRNRALDVAIFLLSVAIVWLAVGLA